MERLKVSVIIPVYNAEKTLRQCLKSVLNQTYDNYEVVVVNNNSTDLTQAIIEEFFDDPKVKCLFEPRKGRGAARHAGENIAQGEIILMTDSDCVVQFDWIEKIIQPILKEGYDAVQGFEQSTGNDFWSRQQQIRSLEKFERIKTKPAKDHIIGNIDTKNFAIKRGVLIAIGYSKKNYDSGNDTALSIHFQEGNFKLRFLSEVKVKHFYPESFREVVFKFFSRAVWCFIISKDYYSYLIQTSFFKDTAQTLWSFIKIFPGVLRAIVKRGIGYAYYDLITGLAWRAGVIFGWIKEKSIMISKRFKTNIIVILTIRTKYNILSIFHPGKLPDFIIVGAQKAGTSSLIKNLQKHPLISTAMLFKASGSKRLEVHFFDRESNWLKGVKWYKHLFKPGTFCGEKTPKIMSLSTAVTRMASVCPQSKIIIVLRNPVDRLYSFYNLSQRRFPELFKEWLKAGFNLLNNEDKGCNYTEEERLAAEAIRRGFYGEQLEVIFRYYPRRQVHIIINERMRKDTSREIDRIYEFFNLPAHHLPNSEYINRKSNYLPMNSRVRKQLVEFYQPYNEKLYQLLGYRIGEWD